MNSQTATHLTRAWLLCVAALALSGRYTPGLILAGLGILIAVLVRRARGHYETDRFAFSKLIVARQLLADGEAFLASKMAADAAAHAKTRRTRNAAWITVAWAALAQGYRGRAKAALEAIEPNYEIDLHCAAAVDAAKGRPEEAIRALELALSSGSLNREGAKLLIDLYAGSRGLAYASMGAFRCRNVLGLEACRLVVNAACDSGEYAASAPLASALFDATGAAQDEVALMRALSKDFASAGLADPRPGRGTPVTTTVST